MFSARNAPNTQNLQLNPSLYTQIIIRENFPTLPEPNKTPKAQRDIVDRTSEKPDQNYFTLHTHTRYNIKCIKRLLSGFFLRFVLLSRS